MLGALLLVWSFVVWRWNDPFTALYTRWQQDKLETNYATLARTFDRLPEVRRAESTSRGPAVAKLAERYRRFAGEGDGIGRIRVPRLGIDMMLVNGTDTTSLRKGPGRDPRTYMPGEGQLVYVAGHRTTYLAPFAHIDRLRRGDRATLEMPYGTFVYRVTGHVIVPANDIARLRSHGREVLALQACHPRFFASQRWLVYGALVSAKTSNGRSVSLEASG